MRARRGLVIAATVGAVLWSPLAARADGGAYIAFDRTHYLPGETATGEAYVYLEEQHQRLLDRGPFYAYLLTEGAVVRPGHAVPAGAIRVGTFRVERSRPEWFEMKVSFAVPELAGDFYPVVACNDPCTISGFKEPLSGLISIVQTAREGALLTQRQQLRGRLYALRRRWKKTEKAMAELNDRLVDTNRVRLTMADEMSRPAGPARSERERARSHPEATDGLRARDRAGARAARAGGGDRGPGVVLGRTRQVADGGGASRRWYPSGG